MVDAGTLATTAQVILAIGEGASDDQILETNTNIWILMAESDMESVAGSQDGNGPEIVSNYGNINDSWKQWLAVVASHRAAFYGINQNPDTWSLETSQSKLNVIDSIWQEFKKRILDKDIISAMGL